MGAWLAILLAAAQASPSRPGTEEFFRLPMDELIDRLPLVGDELVYGVLVPAARAFAERIESGETLSPEQWRRALLSTGVLRVRVRWPASQPFAISLRPPGWLPFTRIRLIPEGTVLREATAGSTGGIYCGVAANWAEDRWNYQELGVLPEGVHHIAINLQLERGGRDGPRNKRDSSSEPPRGVFFAGEIAFDVTVVPSLDDALPAAAGPEVDEGLRHSISVAYLRGGAYLVLEPELSAHPELAGLVLSLEVDARRGEETVETVVLRTDTTTSADPRLALRDHVHAYVAALPADVDEVSARSWSFVVRASSDRLLTGWYADRRWSGTIAISLEELIDREQQRNPDGANLWFRDYEQRLRPDAHPSSR